MRKDVQHSTTHIKLRPSSCRPLSCPTKQTCNGLQNSYDSDRDPVHLRPSPEKAEKTGKINAAFADQADSVRPTT